MQHEEWRSTWYSEGISDKLIKDPHLLKVEKVYRYIDVCAYQCYFC